MGSAPRCPVDHRRRWSGVSDSTVAVTARQTNGRRLIGCRVRKRLSRAVSSSVWAATSKKRSVAKGRARMRVVFPGSGAAPDTRPPSSGCVPDEARTQAGAGPGEPHAPGKVGDLERLSGLRGVVTAQLEEHHRPLRLRKLPDRRIEDARPLSLEDHALGRPVRHGLEATCGAVRIGPGWLLRGLEVLAHSRQLDDARLLASVVTCAIDDDPSEPAQKTGAALEAVHAREHDEPGVLDHVLGEGPVLQELERVLAQPPLVAPDQLGLCRAIAGTKAPDELELLLIGGEAMP